MYSMSHADELRQLAEIGASPMVYEVCDWSRLAGKPMPNAFFQGIRLAFNVRACPVIRKSSSGPYHKAGAEVDAFLSKVWEINDPKVPIRREDVYRDWLRDRLLNQGGCTPISIEVASFSLDRLYRRTQGLERKGKLLKRPNVLFNGELEVASTSEFRELLTAGIGRHKRLGFGMIKVRPMRR